jgi:hypothetical protein
MSKKPKEIDFRKEGEAQLEAIKTRIGQEVPLSNRYVRGPRPILVSVEGTGCCASLSQWSPIGPSSSSGSGR